MTAAEGLPEQLEAIVEYLEEAAHVILVDGLPAAADEGDLTVMWARDAAKLREEFGDNEAQAWINTTVGMYLAESAHEIVAISTLLSGGAVTASLSPLLRSMFERLGVIWWILDVEVDEMERAWRAALHVLICWKHYREAADQLGATKVDLKTLAEEHRELRVKVQKRFAPEVDPAAPKDSSLWTRKGSGFPDYTDLASAAMPESIPMRIRRGMYAAQCAMTHPNIVALAETIRLVEAGGLEFFHRSEDIEKLARAAFATLLGGIKAWSSYFNTEADFDNLVDRLDELATRFDGLFTN